MSIDLVQALNEDYLKWEKDENSLKITYKYVLQDDVLDVIFYRGGNYSVPHPGTYSTIPNSINIVLQESNQSFAAGKIVSIYNSIKDRFIPVQENRCELRYFQNKKKLNLSIYKDDVTLARTSLWTQLCPIL